MNDVTTLTGLIRESGLIAKNHGWWDTPFNLSESLLNIVGEVGEAGAWDMLDPSDHIPEYSGIEEELADIVIRCADLLTRQYHPRKVLDMAYRIINAVEGVQAEPEDDLSYLIVVSARRYQPHNELWLDLFEIVKDATVLWEAYRKGGDKTSTFFNEVLPQYIMQIMLRTFAIADHHDLRLEKAIVAKTEFNRTRPYRHGNKLA